MAGASAHEILGIDRQATAKEIRQAYKRLARQYHPDRNPSAEATEQFIAVKAARDEMLEALKNPPPRRDESPSPSQSRPSASRTSSRGTRRNWRTVDPGPRRGWPPPGFDTPRGAGWTSSEAGRRRRERRASRPAGASAEGQTTRPPQSDPLDVPLPPIPLYDAYRSAIWIVAMLAWFVMFGGFMLTLRSWRASNAVVAAPDTGVATEQGPAEDVQEP